MIKKLVSKDYFDLLNKLDERSPLLSENLFPKGMYFSIFEIQKIEEMKRQNTLFLYALGYAYKHRNPLSLEQRAIFDIIERDIMEGKQRAELADIIDSAIDLCTTVRKCGLIKIRNWIRSHPKVINMIALDPSKDKSARSVLYAGKDNESQIN